MMTFILNLMEKIIKSFEEVPEVLSMDDKGPKGLVHVKGSLIQ